MYPYFDTDGISVEGLLREWRWLASKEFSLLAVNAFGDLFLKADDGTVHRLDVTRGRISKIAGSESEFRGAATDLVKKKEWFLTSEEENAVRKGHGPGKGRCVAGKIPWVFRESAGVADNICIMDLYEHVSSMGNIHRQMRDVPNGSKVRIKIAP